MPVSDGNPVFWLWTPIFQQNYPEKRGAVKQLYCHYLKNGQVVQRDRARPRDSLPVSVPPVTDVVPGIGGGGVHATVRKNCPPALPVRRKGLTKGPIAVQAHLQSSQTTSRVFDSRLV
jgi:hypothetical protein